MAQWINGEGERLDLESLDDGTGNRGEPRLSPVSLRFLGQSGVANT
jgi:hypothetical protein